MPNLLHIFIDIRKSLTNAEDIGGIIKGQLILNNLIIDKLKILDENNIIEQIFVENNIAYIEDLKENSKIELNLIFTSVIGYYENVKDFIVQCKFKIPDQEYYIFELDFISSDDNKSIDVINNYKDIQKLIELLIRTSSYHKEENDNLEIVFVSTNILLLFEVTYSYSDIQKLPRIEEIEHHLDSDSPEFEIRKSIFLNELNESLLEESDPLKRFKKLISTWEDFYTQYLKSYNFYLSGFSYHKIISEIDDQKIEYSKKLHSVISEIQTKLIAIPIAFLLIINQFDFSGINYYKNIALFVSSLIFSYLLDILIRNQKNIFNAISDDIQRFKGKLIKENKINREVEDIFSNLNLQKKKQKLNLDLIHIIIWGVSIISFLLLLISIIKVFQEFNICSFILKCIFSYS